MYDALNRLSPTRPNSDTGESTPPLQPTIFVCAFCIWPLSSFVIDAQRMTKAMQQRGERAKPTCRTTVDTG